MSLDTNAAEHFLSQTPKIFHNIFTAMLTPFKRSHYLGDNSDDSSDEAPLLFSPLKSPGGQENCQELDIMDHCHAKEPGRESSKKVRSESESGET